MVGEGAVREGEADDLGAVLAIYNHYVRSTPATFDLRPVTPEDRRGWMEEHLAGRRYRLVVAVEPAGGIAGWATTSPFRGRAAYDTTVESSVYCSPTYVGRGLGSRLYRRLFELIEGEDVERIVAGTTLPNPAAEALHRRFGFEPVGTFHRVGRKFDRFWDVRWYERPARPR